MCVCACVRCLATDTYAPSEASSSRGGGGGGALTARTPSARRADAMTSSAERSNTLPRTGSHVPTSPLPVHRQSSHTPPSVSPRQSPTWRRKAYTSEREVLAWAAFYQVWAVLDLGWVHPWVGLGWLVKFQTFFTLPAGAVAKYCDEYICLLVCPSVREDISGTTRAIFTNFYACCLCPWLGPPPTCLR